MSARLLQVDTILINHQRHELQAQLVLKQVIPHGKYNCSAICLRHPQLTADTQINAPNLMLHDLMLGYAKYIGEDVCMYVAGNLQKPYIV
jgi:hypothetical protein